MFASAGLIGSDAGTSFRAMLLRLANPTGEAADLMNELGLQFYDAQGQFIGMEGVAAQLTEQMGSLSQEERNAALASLFGQDAIRAASILYDQGAEKVREWEAAVDDSGYAAETAATRLDNLKGDWEAFTGALDTALITMGEGADGPLRVFVQGMTDMLDRFGEMPDWAQQAVVGLGTVLTAAGALGGGFLLSVPKIVEYREAIQQLGTGAQRAGRFVSALGKTAAVAGGLLALTAAASRAAEAMGMAGEGAKSLEETLQLMLRNDFDGTFEGVSSEVNSLAEGFELLLGDDFNSQAERFGSSLNFLGLADQVSNTREQFENMGAALAQMVNSGDGDRAAQIFDRLTAAAEEQGFSVEEVTDLFQPYKDALAGAANETELSEDAALSAADAYLEEAEAASSLTDQLSELVDQINEANGVNQDAISANSDYQQTLADVQEQIDNIRNGVEGYAEGLDLSTEAGRNNMDMLQQLASDAQAMAEAQYALDHNTGDYVQRLTDARQTFIDNATALSDNREEAERLADAIFQIPSEKEIEILADTTSAEEKMAALQEWMNQNPMVRKITLESITLEGGLGPGGGREITPGFADGGLVGYANGGISPDIYAGRAGAIHKFAEPETVWEAYISGKPDQRERNKGVWLRAGQMLGVDVGGSGGGPAIGTYAPTLIQRENVSDRRMAQVLAEEAAWRLG